MRKLYRTTEALAIIISAVAATMAGLSLAVPFARTLPVPGQLAFCLLSLLVCGVGVHVLADALERIAHAAGSIFDRSLYTSIDRTFPERAPKTEGPTE